MYGRGGVNLALPRVMHRLHAAGRRQVVLAHEIAAPFSFWPHRSAYALAHRLMWRGIRASTDAIGISTDAWLDRLRGQGHPNSSPPVLFPAPSPSNLPLTPVPADHPARWRAELGLPPDRRIVGFFGSPGSGKQFEWVLAAWRTVRRADPTAVLVAVGGHPTVRLTREEEDGFRTPGYLDSVAASKALQAMDLLALPFVDGVSERRSSFMAGLAHGCPVVTTLGPATGARLRGAAAFRGVEVADGMGAFAASVGALAGQPTERERLSLAARRLYTSEFDWPRLAATLLQHLR
jgi:glycosyltransferase involved in cell wall biosynthesis